MLRKTADMVESGSCVLTDAQASLIIDQLANRPLSKEQASIFLGMSRSNFDRLVREGKLPKGRKVAGFKELFWFSSELKGFAK
jgi:hypothetical protein